MLTKSDLSQIAKIVEPIKEEVLEMRKEHKQYKDEVLTKLDDISGQLENLNEDKVLSFHQTSQLNNKVEDHESRIKHLEKVQTSSV